MEAMFPGNSQTSEETASKLLQDCDGCGMVVEGTRMEQVCQGHDSSQITTTDLIEVERQRGDSILAEKQHEAG